MANEEEEVFDVGDVLFSWACFFGGNYSLLPRLSDSPPSSRNTSAIHNVLRWRSAIGAKSRASRRWWISSIFLLPLFIFLFFFLSLSLSLSLSHEESQGGRGVLPLYDDREFIDWLASFAAHSYHFSWGILASFFFCFLLSCLSLNTSNKSTTNMWFIDSHRHNYQPATLHLRQWERREMFTVEPEMNCCKTWLERVVKATSKRWCTRSKIMQQLFNLLNNSRVTRSFLPPLIFYARDSVNRH